MSSPSHLTLSSVNGNVLLLPVGLNRAAAAPKQPSIMEFISDGEGVDPSSAKLPERLAWWSVSPPCWYRDEEKF